MVNRKELLQKRSRITNRKAKEKAIADKLLPFLKGKENIGIYMPIGSEVNILSFLKKEIFQEFFAPKCLNDYEMDFYKAASFKTGAYGILEPENSFKMKPDSLDVILVPMVGFYETYRLGYGKGYYDRYLAKTKALKIGLAFEEQEADFKPNSWDICMDLIITPERVIRK